MVNVVHDYVYMLNGIGTAGRPRCLVAPKSPFFKGRVFIFYLQNLHFDIKAHQPTSPPSRFDPGIVF